MEYVNLNLFQDLRFLLEMLRRVQHDTRLEVTVVP